MPRLQIKGELFICEGTISLNQALKTIEATTYPLLKDLYGVVVYFFVGVTDEELASLAAVGAAATPPGRRVLANAVEEGEAEFDLEAVILCEKAELKQPEDCHKFYKEMHPTE